MLWLVASTVGRREGAEMRNRRALVVVAAGLTFGLSAATGADNKVVTVAKGSA
jgi:hypothetical protein